MDVINDLLFMLAPCMSFLLAFCNLTRKMHQCFNASVETIVNLFFLPVQAAIMIFQSLDYFGC